FTHVSDAAGASRVNADSDGLVRELYPPGKWKAGEYIKDVQTINLPADWGSPQATLFVGLWNGPHRLHITQGPNDGEDCVRALSVPTQSGSPKPSAVVQDLPELRTVRVDTPPQIDGQLNEPAWEKAQRTPPFVRTLDGSAADFIATAKALWDQENLFLGFQIADNDLQTHFTKRDEHLWEQDCVEILIDPRGDGRHYYEIQVSPTGVLFDTKFDGVR